MRLIKSSFEYKNKLIERIKSEQEIEKAILDSSSHLSTREVEDRKLFINSFDRFIELVEEVF